MLKKKKAWTKMKKEIREISKMEMGGEVMDMTKAQPVGMMDGGKTKKMNMGGVVPGRGGQFKTEVMSSDEADRRRTYAELERRGQKVPGKYFGPSTPKLRVKKTPEVKTIDMTKMKQLKLFRLGGLASADPFGDKRRQESARTMAKLKRGAKTAKKS